MIAKRFTTITWTGLFLGVLAFGCGSSNGDTGVDGGAQDETLFQDALVDYNAMDYSTAMTKFDQLLTTYPDSRRHDNAGYLTGRCRYQLGMFPETVTAMAAMVAAHPSSPFVDSATYFSGRARYRMAKLPVPTATYTEALADFNASLAADSTGIYADNAQYFAGRCHFELTNFAASITALSMVEQNYPTSSYVDNADYYLGRAHHGLMQYPEAIMAFTRVFRDVNSRYLDNARYRLGRVKYDMPDLPAALLEFEDIETTYPTSIFADNSLYYRVRIHVDNANCVEANNLLTTLQSSFTASNYIARAQAYMAAGGC